MIMLYFLQKLLILRALHLIQDMYQDLLYYAKSTTAKCGELLMKAINYALAEWKGLIRYTENGMYRVDNNAAYHNLNIIPTFYHAAQRIAV